MRQTSGATLLALAFLIGAAHAAGQQLSISGTVSDNQGVVPGAVVNLVGPTGAKRTTDTDSQGKYNFDGLIPGPYELSFTREGFAPATRKLSLTSESRVSDISLTAAGIATSVDVIDVGGKSTGTRMEISDREVPSQISVVSQQTMREQGITDLAGALENVSGVTTQVQYGVYEWYTIGGFTQQSGNDFLFIDGMTRTGNRSATQINNIEEVQVFKGPNAVLYGGAGASQGGSVNVIRKKPQALREHELLYRFGRWGLNQFGGGTTGQVFGLQRLLYRVDASFWHADGFRQAGALRRNVSPSLTWLITDRIWITTNQTFIDDKYDLDAGVPVNVLAKPGFPLDRRFNPSTDFQKTREWQNSIVFHVNITNRLQFRNSFLKIRVRDQYLDAETLAYTPATDTLTRTELYFQHNRRPVQNQSDFIGDYRFFGLRHRFLIGYDYSDQKNFTNRTGVAPNTSTSAGIPIPSIVLADFLKPGFVDPAPTYTFFPRTRVDHSTQATNAFAWQDQIDITEKLKINIAGRYDDWQRRTHNDVWDNDRFVSRAPDANQKHQTNYSYRAGAVYAITQAHWVYFSSSSTFQPVTTVSADNKQFEPTKTRSYDVGYKLLAFRNRLIANVGLRKIDNRNILVSVGANLFEQAGRSSSKVVDFDLEGQLGRGIRASANYGYALPRYDEFHNAAGQNLAGFMLPHSPRHKARVWLTKLWKVGEKTTLSSSLGANYSYRYFTNAGNTIILPSRFTMDGALNLMRARWEVGVNFSNLTNKERYFVSQINGGNQLYPGQPFSAMLTVRYRFQ
jgi:outer membrane receptor protein involved in Fe transport